MPTQTTDTAGDAMVSVEYRNRSSVWCETATLRILERLKANSVAEIQGGLKLFLFFLGNSFAGNR